MIRVSSIFSQMLQLFSRHEFERAVAEHRGERHARGFICWGQFVAMLFCHLGRAQTLREICGGLAASEGKLRHLGLPDAQALHLGLCQRTPPLAVVPRRVLSTIGPLPRGRRPAWIPLQEQEGAPPPMKQAVEEGFILDVLKSYTPVNSYYKLVKKTEDDPEFDTKKAKKKLRR